MRARRVGGRCAVRNALCGVPGLGRARLTPITITAGSDRMLMLPTLSAAGFKLDGQGGTNALDYPQLAS